MLVSQWMDKQYRLTQPKENSTTKIKLYKRNLSKMLAYNNNKKRHVNAIKVLVFFGWKSKKLYECVRSCSVCLLMCMLRQYIRQAKTIEWERETHTRGEGELELVEEASRMGLNIRATMKICKCKNGLHVSETSDSSWYNTQHPYP